MPCFCILRRTKSSNLWDPLPSTHPLVTSTVLFALFWCSKLCGFGAPVLNVFFIWTIWLAWCWRLPGLLPECWWQRRPQIVAVPSPACPAAFLSTCIWVGILKPALDLVEPPPQYFSLSVHSVATIFPGYLTQVMPLQYGNQVLHKQVKNCSGRGFSHLFHFRPVHFTIFSFSFRLYLYGTVY